MTVLAGYITAHRLCDQIPIIVIPKAHIASCEQAIVIIVCVTGIRRCGIQVRPHEVPIPLYQAMSKILYRRGFLIVFAFSSSSLILSLVAAKDTSTLSETEGIGNIDIPLIALNFST